MRVVPFRAEHALGLDPRPLHLAGGMDRERLAALASAYARAGPAFTLLEGGEPAACGGLALQPGATADAWMLSGPLIERRPLGSARAVRRGLEAVERECGVSRIQTTSPRRGGASRAWFAFLGFRLEGILRRLVHDEDYYLYARVKQWEPIRFRGRRRG